MVETVLAMQTHVNSVEGRIGVIDIGSNTVRLVVYDAPERLPVPMFNEKSECRLVEGLSESGNLSPKGVERALNSLHRFVRLASAMGVEILDLLATAAVREAKDGNDFVQRVRDEVGVEVTVLSGAEEAELSALGLVAGVPNASGVLGDLGGGSMDLISLDDGRQQGFGSTPLGHVRLREMSGGKPARARSIILSHFDDIDWLNSTKGKELYLAGGIMRAIARVFIEQTDHPLHIVDNFRIKADDAERLARLLARLSQRSLKQMTSFSPNRLKSIPYAATVLQCLIEVTKPERVVFSGFGMREGQMIRRLPEDMRKQDPLVAGVESLAGRMGRFSLTGREVADWIAPLFPEAEELDIRRILVACILSDVGWKEHPDYRAEHAFYSCLRLPYAGLSHADRVFIAATVYVRYNGDPDAPLVNSVRGLLEAEQLAKVDGVGRAIRLAHTISGSAPGILWQTRLERRSKTLYLHLPGNDMVFESETVERRFRSLAKSIGLRSEISRD